MEAVSSSAWFPSRSRKGRGSAGPWGAGGTSQPHTRPSPPFQTSPSFFQQGQNHGLCSYFPPDTPSKEPDNWPSVGNHQLKTSGKPLHHHSQVLTTAGFITSKTNPASTHGAALSRHGVTKNGSLTVKHHRHHLILTAVLNVSEQPAEAATLGYNVRWPSRVRAHPQVLKASSGRHHHCHQDPGGTAIFKGDSNGHDTEEKEEISKTPSVIISNNFKHIKASVKARDPGIPLFSPVFTIITTSVESGRLRKTAGSQAGVPGNFLRSSTFISGSNYITVYFPTTWTVPAAFQKDEEIKLWKQCLWSKALVCKHSPRKQRHNSVITLKLLSPCLFYPLALDMLNFALSFEVFLFWYYRYNSEEANYVNS